MFVITTVAKHPTGSNLREEGVILTPVRGDPVHPDWEATAAGAESHCIHSQHRGVGAVTEFSFFSLLGLGLQPIEFRMGLPGLLA